MKARRFAGCRADSTVKIKKVRTSRRSVGECEETYPVDSGLSRCSMLSDRIGRGRILMARARSLAEFQKSFPDEESCAAFLFKQRWPDGFVCPGCGKRRVV